MGDRFRQVQYETTEGADYEGGDEDVPDADDSVGTEEWAPSREDWDNMTAFQTRAGPVLEQLGTLLQTPLDLDLNEAGYEGGDAERPEFDPFDSDSVQNYIGTSIQRGIEEALGPFQGLLGTVAAREGETLAKGELERISGEVGEFDRDTAFLVASGLIEQGADPSMALERAATYSRDFETRIRADEREKYRKELEALAGAPNEMPTNSASAIEGDTIPRGQDRYRVAVERALGNNHPEHPAG